MASRKVVTIGAAGFFAFMLLGATFAWACTTQPYMQISPKSGEPGTVVEINANGFSTGSRVELRWGSANGKKLGEASGPSFSVPVLVPDVSPGVYYVLAIEMSLTGAQGNNNVARDSFEVTPAAPRQEPSQNTPTPRRDNDGGDRSPTGQPQERGRQAPPVSRTETASERPASLGPAPTEARSVARPANEAAAASQGSGPDGGGPAGRGQGGPPSGPAADGARVQAGGPAAPDASRSLARTVSSDLWSGFERATVSPSLLEPSEQPAFREREFVIGISILGTGLLALLGGAGVLVAGRRRTLAGMRDS